MQKLFLKKLFKRSDNCDVAPGKYYFYVKGHALESNICGYISDGNDFASLADSRVFKIKYLGLFKICLGEIPRS